MIAYLILSEPWLHVGYFMLGCCIGDYYPKMERRLVEDINVLRAEKGLLPLVGTAAWVRYKGPEVEDGPVGKRVEASLERK
jgi:hypothetical protein